MRVICFLLHFAHWIDVSTDRAVSLAGASAGVNVASETIIECMKCRRRYVIKILRRARSVTRTPR
jgi:hypothetical protein